MTPKAAEPVFAPFLARWGLTPDGEAILTSSSRLLPVRRGGAKAMLKVALAEEDKRGGALMVWWGGEGAARVLAHCEDALLLERAEGGSLVRLVREGRDDAASRIICDVVARLHAPRGEPPEGLTPLSVWFRALPQAASRHGGVLTKAAAAARDLLGAPREIAVLHGDVHHGNILDFGGGDWRAIDPKGLVGERGFDYANLFCNPDRERATAPGRLARQAAVVAEKAGLERRRLLTWVLAYAGLSAAWFLEEGENPASALAMAQLASRLLQS